ncbi:MAG: sigma-54-dependent Fis family transcriptional regulator [Deltaproteobacteria bacterium]|nr:sigma-54-dependent Fis family transcriptional regulator [Deltaproteobacteria bacterium]
MEAEGVDTALARLDGIDLALVDVRLSDDPSDRSGLTLLREIRRSGSSLPVVIVSGSSATADLRDAMRLGARDYVLKDHLCEEVVLPIVESFRERITLDGEVRRLRAQVEDAWGIEAIVGSSPTMDRVRRTIARVANADAPVLILGETGVGKEMVARAIHHASARHEQPFVAVNCTAIPSALLESMLFGHEKGAFTGADRQRAGRMAAAGKGTILLDEIGDLPLDVQSKLLRVLEERRILPVGADRDRPLQARVVAATNVDLARRVQEGRFRSDLYYRLDVVTIHVPSLAERGRADLEELLFTFTASQPRRLRYTPEAIEWLVARPWPGNVRELKNFVRRLSIMAEVALIDVATLEALSGRPERGPASSVEALVDEVLGSTGEADSPYRLVERAMIRRALDQTGGNRSAAARLLGVSRKALGRRWARLESDDDRDADDDGDDA